MFAAIICDLDGLLADTERLHFWAYRLALAGMGIELSEREYDLHWVRLGRGVQAFLAARGLAADDLAEIRRRKAEEYRRLVRLKAEPMPGARELLERFRPLARLALASASYADAVACVLGKLAFTDYFEVVVSGSEVARAKPFPDIFLLASERLGLDPRRCVVLEDSQKGVAAARAAGMACVAVPNAKTAGHDFSLASAVVDSLNRISSEFLASLAGRAREWPQNQEHQK